MLSHFAKLVFVMCAVVPIYSVLRWIFLRRRARRGKAAWAREFVLGVFVVFCFALAFLVLEAPAAAYKPATMWSSLCLRLRTGEGINLVPLHTIRRFFAGGLSTAFMINIVGNVLMFVPLGLGLPLLWKRWQRVWRLLMAAICIPLCIECAQLFIGRSSDIDDIILNTLGILSGGVIYLLCRKIWPALGRLAEEAKKSAAILPAAA